MGGSSKPADPKVTPFVEPAAPSKPIPNFFGGQGGAGYTPDFNSSKAAFGQQPIQQPAQPVSQPMQPQTYSQPAAQGDWGGMNAGQQVPATGQPRPMSFSIPTQQDWGTFMPQMQQMAQGMGRFRAQGLPDYGNIASFMPQLRDMFQTLRGSAQNAPRYSNYTDTDPALTTDASGNPFMPSNRFGGA